MNNTSTWNGYTVHGDIKELDFIAEAEGMTCLDKNDILSILSSEGENWITVGAGTDMGHAFNEAINNLPCKIDRVNSLLINLSYGSKDLIISEFLALQNIYLKPILILMLFGV